jgi:hypothetical protein
MTVRELIDKLILLVEDGCANAPVVHWENAWLEPIEPPYVTQSKEGVKRVVIE